MCGVGGEYRLSSDDDDGFGVAAGLPEPANLSALCLTYVFSTVPVVEREYTLLGVSGRRRTLPGPASIGEGMAVADEVGCSTFRACVWFMDSFLNTLGFGREQRLVRLSKGGEDSGVATVTWR